jgi:hypothetical protein
MSDNLLKLIEAASLLGLTAEKTPGSRYRFTNEAGEQVHVAANMGKAVEYLVGLRDERKAEATAAAPKAPKAPRAPKAAPAAAEPVPAQVVNEFRNMKNGIQRASLLRQLVADHGRRQVMADLGISAPTLDEQVRSIRLYEQSQVLRDLVNSSRLSWSQLVGKVSIRMKLGIEGQEQLALEIAKPAIAAVA